MCRWGRVFSLAKLPLQSGQRLVQPERGLMHQEGPVSQHADPKAVLAKQCSEGPPTPTEDLSKTPLFAPCGTSFVSEIVLVAQPETYQPGESIWLQGEECKKVYILKSGEVELIQEDHMVLHTWSAGTMLGLCILLNVHHRLRTAQAATVCECLALPSTSFHAILKQHPAEKKHFLEAAQAEAKGILGDRQFECLVGEVPKSPPKSFHRKSHNAGHDDKLDKSPKKSKALEKLPTIEPVTKPFSSSKLVPSSLPISSRFRRPSWSKRCASMLDDDSGSDTELNAVSAQFSERQISTQSSPDVVVWSRSSTAPTFPHALLTPDHSGTGTGSHLLVPRPPASSNASRENSPTPSAASKSTCPEPADDISPASKKATYWCDVIKDWFGCLDTDGSGRIDREEFKNIAKNLSAAFAWDDHQSALLLQEIDTNSDEQVDLPEFAGWLTNVHATMTFSPEGWLQTYDLGDTLQPLYECYDPDRSGISKDQFLRTYRIIANALKHTPVALQKKADVWVRAAEEEYENLNDDGKDMLIEIDDFIQWQAQLLKHSGIPNSVLPEKVAGLARALKVINDLDKKSTVADDKDEAVLSKSIQKVATLARELYLPCSQQLRKLLEANNHERKEEPCDENYKWENPPDGAVNRLRRDCAINLGVLLPGILPHKSGETSKSDVWRFARRNSHMRNRKGKSLPQAPVVGMAMSSMNRRLMVAKLAIALLAVRVLMPSFVSPSGPSIHAQSPRRQLTAVRAEGEAEEDGDMLEFLKVEQDIELSPEEYKMALEAEVETQRKKYYIGGVVDPKNLVVPWKPVDEDVLVKDARRTLKKNGIRDPAGGDVDTEYDDSEMELTLIDDDVNLQWAGGVPGTKVGYIIERKPAGSTNFEEIATYDNMKNPQLLAKPYSGHEYTFTDSMVAPGKYTYRLLCRSRDGSIDVVDQKELLVADAPGVDLKIAFPVLGAFVLFSALYGFSLIEDNHFLLSAETKNGGMNTPVLGELLLCFHSSAGSLGKTDRFFAWLEAPRKSESDRKMYYELVPRDDGCGNALEPEWQRLPDGAPFHAELERLPKEQVILAILKTQELAHEQLQWPQVQRSLGLAECLELVMHEDVEQVSKVIHTFARQHVMQQPWHREQLEMGMTISDIVDEHLQEAVFSPEEVLHLLLNQEKMADPQPEPKNKLVATLSKMFSKNLSEA
ncbi:Cyclic nucleotide-gated cation channel alpha-4 [Symbiodinium microadriaticum]|uniref:Cyclic nucleotide-gated cation channel alpha-4 n=1 Tax=Symbiodinium microadriaticum TaxID=2951 RepID=A0A1Q9DP90_SYMMI|nr:Cyclic nucleotide-gated cation channel alpha-4 [Symbiodinium microadriaticum]